MIWRDVERHELAQCLALDSRCKGEAIVGEPNASLLWKTLFQHLAFNCALVEVAAPLAPRIVAFGASVFLDPEFADRELRHPAPDINSRIFASILSGSPVLRKESQLVAPADRDGLDLLLLCSSFSFDGLPAAQQLEATVLLPQALVHLHLGYRIRRILMETTSEPMRLLAASSGVWKTVASFPSDDRTLMMVTQEEAMGAAGFGLLGPLFLHKPPILELRDTEKQLLCKAIHGDTDLQIADSLHLAVSSVKKRWTSLFARISTLQPRLMPENESSSRNDGRGSQKRHRILTYVREHPEELRPFRWYPAQTADVTVRPGIS